MMMMMTMIMMMMIITTLHIFAGLIISNNTNIASITYFEATFRTPILILLTYHYSITLLNITPDTRRNQVHSVQYLFKAKTKINIVH